MIKATTVFLLDLFVAAIASKLIDTFWGNQPQITPAIIFVIAGGILLVYFQNERELALTWVFHRFVFLINARNQYRRMLEIKTGKNAKVFGSNSAESYLHITNGKINDDFSSLCCSRINNTKNRQKLLITGNPGSGKSFGLIKTAHSLAQFSIYKLGFGTPIPILLRCDEYKGNLADLLKNKLAIMSKGESGKILGKGIDKLLRDGKIVILLDAIDETVKDYRSALVTEIENISSSPAYEDCSVIITGRQSDIDLQKFEKLEFDVFEVKDLTDAGVNRFISIYKQEHQISDDIAKALKDNNLIEDNGLGRNPFWLSLMVEQNIFGANYVVVLDQSIDKLMRSEFEKPKSSNRWDRKLPIDTQVIETRLALSALAFEMICADKTVLEFDDAKNTIEKFILDRNAENLRGHDVIGLAQDSHILELAKLSGGKQNPVRFRHPLLRDFMAACYTLEESIIEEKFELLSQDIKRWWYVLFFSVSLLSESKSPWLNFERHKTILEFLVGSESYPNIVLMIACSMTTFEKHLEKEFYDQVLTRLEQLFNQELTDDIWKGIDDAINVAPEYIVETINDIFERQKTNELPTILDYLVQISIKSGHKSQLLLHLLDQYKMEELVVAGLVKAGTNAVNPLVEIIEAENEYSKRERLPLADEDIELKLRLREWRKERRKAMALSALVKISPLKATPYFENILSSTKPLGKSKIIKLIGESNNHNAIPILLKELKKDNDPFEYGIKSEIYNALAQMGDEGLVALLDLLSKSNFAEVSMFHIDDAVASYGIKAIEGLRKLLKKRKDDVILAVFEVIKKNKNPLLLPDLFALLKEDDYFICIRTAEVMAEFGDAAVPYLIDGLSANPSSRRMVNSYIVDALAEIGKPAIQSLINLTSSPENMIVASATEALGKIKDYRTISLLENLLKSHANVEVTINAGVGLGRLKEEKTRKILQKVYERTFGDSGQWGRTIGAMLGLVHWGDINMRATVMNFIANGGLFDDKKVDDDSRLQLVAGLTELQDTTALPSIYKFREELFRDNSKESLKNAKHVSTFAEILEDILHPKKDPRVEELELASKKRDEEYAKITEND